jgi:hypothetical protein
LVGNEFFEVWRGAASLKGQQVQRWRLTTSKDGKAGMGLSAMMRLMIE